MLNLTKYAEFLRKRNKFFYVLIDLSREMREEFVYINKTKTHEMKVHRRRSLFKDDKQCKSLFLTFQVQKILHTIINIEDLRNLKAVVSIQNQLIQL